MMLLSEISFFSKTVQGTIQILRKQFCGMSNAYFCLQGGWVGHSKCLRKQNLQKDSKSLYHQSNIKSYLNSIYSFDFELSKKHQNYLNFWSFLTSLVVPWHPHLVLSKFAANNYESKADLEKMALTFSKFQWHCCSLCTICF